jgi:hypothetical protein
MSTVKANDLTNVTGGIPTVKGQDLIPTAWVNFNGTGTIAIRESENVSSLTDDGVGDAVINFETNMANTNYSFTASGSGNSFGTADTCIGPYEFGTGLVKMGIYHSGSVAVDRVIVCVTILGGQS